MISLELIKQIDPNDDDAIDDAFDQLAAELRDMKLNDDFSDINAMYDALNAIRETTAKKLEKMSSEEIENMIFEDGKNMFYFQREFIKDRHPEWDSESEGEKDSESSQENVSA